MCGINSYKKFSQTLIDYRALTTHQEGRRQEILNEPELDSAVCVAKYAEDHDANEPLEFERSNMPPKLKMKRDVPRREAQKQR